MSASISGQPCFDLIAHTPYPAGLFVIKSGEIRGKDTWTDVKRSINRSRTTNEEKARGCGKLWKSADRTFCGTLAGGSFHVN